jgi:hypothetical protein
MDSACYQIVNLGRLVVASVAVTANTVPSQITLLPRTASMEHPSNEHNNTERHQCKTSSLGNSAESEETLKTSVLWNIVCSQVGVYRRFRGGCCLHHQDDVMDYKTSATSVNSYRTTRIDVPEESHLYTRCCYNLTLK